MTISVHPHPQIMCDTIAERDSISPRSGIRVFCRETGSSFSFDATWKAASGGEQGPPGDDGYTPIKGVDYFDGDPGAPGSPGPPGADSTVPGPPGSDADVTGHEAAYDHPAVVSHAGSTHAPATAQANADITKAEIEAKLTGEIVSHSHAGGGGQPVGMTVLANDTTAVALATYFNVKLTVTAARTLTTTVPPAGTRCAVVVLTSGTTSRVITFGTGFKAVTTLATGTTSGRVFVVNFISDGTNLYEAGRTAAMVA